VQDRVDGTLDVEVRGHILLDEGEPGIAEQVRDVVRAPGEEVIDADDGVAVGKEPLAQVRTDEAGAAGDDDACHACSVPG